VSPGALLDAETTRVLRAAGTLVTMVVKRKISRDRLATIVSELRTAAENLEKVSRC
jgi:hypothetical protein